VVLQEIPDDAELRRSWNELAEKMERPEVFYTYDWAVACQRAYGRIQSLLVFLGYEGELLVAVGSLAIQNTEPEAAGFLTGTTSDYCDFLSEPGWRREFIEAVFGELKRRRVGKIVLANLPADSCSVSAISAAASSSRYRLFTRTGYLCARVVLGSAEQRVSLKQRVLGRKMLRQNLRGMESRAPLTVRHDTRWEDIEPVLRSFSKSHIARFLATGRISNLIRSERRVFLHELARELSRSGWLRLSRLLVGETSVAWNYGFQFAGSWFWYQPTLNSGYEQFSPGFCLLSKIVETACDQPGVEVVDLGLGAEGYKERFATSNRQTLHLTLNHSIVGHLKTVMRSRVASIATASPRVEGWIRTLIAYQTRLRRRLRETGFVGVCAWLSRRIWSSLFSRREASFFVWNRREPDPLTSGALTLRPLDFDLVAEAAMRYADDPDTLSYLLRSAQRLRAGNQSGFALMKDGSTPVHFCWVNNFEGFEIAELGRTLRAPSADAVLIFDCFTPPSARGNAFFSSSISMLADQLRAACKVPWIFAAPGNRASIKGIKKSGFTYRFRLRRNGIIPEAARDSAASPRPANVAPSASTS
jgi:CelD/BcsL family acetyltransferase involved in cellulose biosynthesis